MNEMWQVFGIMIIVFILWCIGMSIVLDMVSKDVKSWLQDIGFKGRLSDDIMEKVKQNKPKNHTIKQQVEYWLTIGHLAEQNPHMTIGEIKDTFMKGK